MENHWIWHFTDIYFAERYHGGAEWHDVENAVQAEHAQQASETKNVEPSVHEENVEH